MELLACRETNILLDKNQVSFLDFYKPENFIKSDTSFITVIKMVKRL